MQKKVFQLLADNTSGVLSRISGLFSRRGYNIESITAGETTKSGLTRITIVTSGDDEVLEQIEKQVAKLVDIHDIQELKPEASVYRELILIKVRAALEQRQGIIAVADSFRAKIIDFASESLMIELTGDQQKIEAFIGLMQDYGILELARTGIAGLGRGTDHIIYSEQQETETLAPGLTCQL
ncbi:MAG: acetolactate synthase small subunit [Acetatifactor sp.]|nr:acetolactate synthase small subunit [Acetatifactor sp.]